MALIGTIRNEGYQFIGAVGSIQLSPSTKQTIEVRPTVTFTDDHTIQDWVPDFAKIYGSSVDQLENAIRSNTVNPITQNYLELSKRYATPANLVTFCARYYGDQSNRYALRRYSLHVNGRLLDTTIFTRSELIGLRQDPLRSTMIWETDDPPAALLVSTVSPIVKQYAEEVAARLKYLKVRLWSAPSYRLLNLSSLDNRLLFSEVPFFSYRFAYGIIEDELTDALIGMRGNVDTLLGMAKTLPLRTRLLPNLNALGDLRNRVCCGGLGVVFALKRSSYNDYYIPLQIRSKDVNDGRELLALIPKGFHQPSTSDLDEVNVYWTVFRELAEEIFRKKEKETLGKNMVREHVFSYPELRWFIDNRDAWHCEVVSVGLNSVNGNYDFGILLMVDDVRYYPTFLDQFFANWETERIKWVSTMDTRELHRLFTEQRWASESLFHFAEGRLRLKEIAPQCIALPSIERVLHGQ
jgi:hypothetical protein